MKDHFAQRQATSAIFFEKCTAVVTYVKHYDFNLGIHLDAKFWKKTLFAAEITLSHLFRDCCLPYIVVSTLIHIQRIFIILFLLLLKISIC